MRRTVLPLALAAAVVALSGAPAPEALGAEIEDAAWGLRFEPPAGWVRQPAPEGYLFVAPDQRGLLAVLPHEVPSLEALRAEARQGIADGAGTALQLQGTVEAFGDNGLVGDYVGWIEGNPARARVVGLVAPHGRGATIVVATAPEHYSDEYAALSATVAESLVLNEPPLQLASTGSAPAQAAGAEEREWQEFLEGCRLSYFNRYDSGYGGGGYSDETVIDLCSGYFTFGDHSETVFNTTDPVSGDQPYLHSDVSGSGQWSVVRQGGESVLQLRFQDGSMRSHTLGYEDGKTFLDGRRWLRTCNPNDAVVEARPQCR
jgi:hypothetical protein